MNSVLIGFLLGIAFTLWLGFRFAAQVARLFSRIAAPEETVYRVRRSTPRKPPAACLTPEAREDAHVSADWAQYRSIPRYQRQKAEKLAWANALDARREKLERETPDEAWAALKSGDPNYDLFNSLEVQ